MAKKQSKLYTFIEAIKLAKEKRYFFKFKEDDYYWKWVEKEKSYQGYEKKGEGLVIDKNETYRDSIILISSINNEVSFKDEIDLLRDNIWEVYEIITTIKRV